MTRHTSVIQKSKKPASIRNLKKDVKAVIEKLICAVEAEVDGERKEGISLEVNSLYITM